MKDELLIDLAKTTLKNLLGSGEWTLSKHFVPISKEDRLGGLSKGDIVYSRLDDIVGPAECEVLAVVDGVGYIQGLNPVLGPCLLPVEKQFYAKTFAETADDSAMAELEDSKNYYQEKLDQILELERKIVLAKNQNVPSQKAEP